MNQIALVTDGSNEACFSVNEKIHNFNVSFITTRKRSLGQGNVLTHVSFCSQEEGVCIGGGDGQTPSLDTTGCGQRAGSTHPTGIFLFLKI